MQGFRILGGDAAMQIHIASAFLFKTKGSVGLLMGQTQAFPGEQGVASLPALELSCYLHLMSLFGLGLGM